MSSKSLHRIRRGFVLPFVIVSLVLIAALASATTLSAWRSVRAARLGFNGERAVQGADEGLATALATWDSPTFAARAIGARWQAAVTTADGGVAELSFVRTGPLVAVVSARMESRTRGAPDTARRRLTRYLWLEAPAFPARAAFGVLGPLTIEGNAVIDGRDSVGPDPCDPLRDTLSAAGVFGEPATIDPTVTLYGAPPLLTPGVASLDAARASFDSAWSVTLSRVSTLERTAPGAALSAASAWGVRRAVPDTSAALPSSSMSPGVITLGGASTHRGLLLIDGDLELVGALTVEGVLLVRGALDTRSGTLVVNGAVIVRDDAVHGSVLGTSSRLHYSPCTTARAFAAIARVRTRPFGSWIER